MKGRNFNSPGIGDALKFTDYFLYHRNGRGDKRGHHGYNSGYGPGYGCMCCPDYLDVHVRTSMGRCPIHGTRVPYHRPRYVSSRFEPRRNQPDEPNSREHDFGRGLRLTFTLIESLRHTQFFL